jgi:hypothetical protein
MMDGKDNNISPECARFIADYVNELIAQGDTITKYTIMCALGAYYGKDDDND